MGDQHRQVLIHRTAEKALNKLHGDLLERIRNAIRALADDPKPVGCTKLSGYENLYRIRAGDWRIIYAIGNNILIVLILEIAPRGRVYRDF